MKVPLLVILAMTPLVPAWADDGPCASYAYALAYSRTRDASLATLTLTEPKTGAEIEMRLPRNFTANRGNLTDGEQCQIAVELTWPGMTAGGLLEERDRLVRDRVMGDVLVWRNLTIDAQVNRSPWARWFTPSAYCRLRMKRPELGDRPFGLRAFDDGTPWPRHRQSDGSYRGMRELLPYPLNSANKFYFIDDDGEQMIRISCSKGAPRCQLHDHFAGFQTTTFLNADDISNWRLYRDGVRRFLNEHTVRRKPATLEVDPGRFGNPDPAFVACMWDMQASIGADMLRRMGLRPANEPR
jgi:hypothetical protein